MKFAAALLACLGSNKGTVPIVTTYPVASTVGR